MKLKILFRKLWRQRHVILMIRWLDAIHYLNSNYESVKELHGTIFACGWYSRNGERLNAIANKIPALDSKYKVDKPI